MIERSRQAVMDIVGYLHAMRSLGSSVSLTWGEDDGLWECSWITSGQRYTATNSQLYWAVLECWNKAERVKE